MCKLRHTSFLGFSLKRAAKVIVIWWIVWDVTALLAGAVHVKKYLRKKPINPKVITFISIELVNFLHIVITSIFFHGYRKDQIVTMKTALIGNYVLLVTFVYLGFVHFFVGVQLKALTAGTFLLCFAWYPVATLRGDMEVRVDLQIERWVARGGSVRLRCLHDVPPHLLDKIVFLRQGTKIFQYIKNRKPPFRNFTTPGAILNVALATQNSIILQDLEFQASGMYSCEVTIDVPIFTKASSEKQLTVIQPQKHPPRIENHSTKLTSGEMFQSTCTSSPALPAPHITWLINGEKVEEATVRRRVVRAGQARAGRHRLQPRNEHAPASQDHCLNTLHSGNASAPLELADQSSNEIRVSRHRSRRPSKDLFVSISELNMALSSSAQVTCVSTIPEFRTIHDKFADIRNQSIYVEVQPPALEKQPPANLSMMPDVYSSKANSQDPSTILFICGALLKICKL